MLRGIRWAVGRPSTRSAPRSSPLRGYNGGVATKNCFIDKTRPCDLTCKAAFPVDDAVDPVDCFFIWLAGHLGDGVVDVRQILEQRGFPFPGGGPGGDPPAGPSMGFDDVSPN